MILQTNYYFYIKYLINTKTSFMKKFFLILLTVVILGFAGFYAFAYYVTFSDGDRTGKLVKFSRKGVVFKTWEGQISYGVSDENAFYFSVLDNQEKTIADLRALQGQTVKLSYVERFRTFKWWGDTKYFVNSVQALSQSKPEKKDIPKEKDDSTVLLEKENEMLKQRIKDLETTIEILKESSK